MEISYEAVFNAHMRQLTVSTITFNTKKVWDSSSTYRGSETQKGQQRRSLGRLREQVNMLIYFKRTSDIWVLVCRNMGFFRLLKGRLIES